MIRIRHPFQSREPVLTRTYPVSISSSAFYNSTGFSYLSLSLGFILCFFLFSGFYVGFALCFWLTPRYQCR